jgi:SagB-type dehydrogenase family enzyme
MGKRMLLGSGAALFIFLAMLLLGFTGKPAAGGGGFHERTKLSWLSAIKGALAPGESPREEKKRTGLMRISLPAADHNGLTVEEAMRKRRSVRNYSRGAVDLAGLSQLLFAAQGITGRTYGTKLRTAPSAGALFPIELYVFAHNVEDLPPGLYHYDPEGHWLTQLKKGDFSAAVMGAGLKQEMLEEAALVIVLTAVPVRTTWKYGERGFRYIYMEAGHIAENVLLQAASLGLGAVPVGAFLDDRLDGLLDVDGREEISLYLMAVGKPR